jgi:hypothetical protein
MATQASRNHSSTTSSRVLALPRSETACLRHCARNHDDASTVRVHEPIDLVVGVVRTESKL